MAGDVTASDEAAARDLLEQAQAQLSSLDPHVATGFAAQLYGRAVPEDLLHYGPADLAMLAAHAYALLAERTPGTAKIRCEKVMLADSGERKAIGVVEIVNDDMPFLLDSVMGELSERRLPVRLVAHPVLDVQRESGRSLTIRLAQFARFRDGKVHEFCSITDTLGAAEQVMGRSLIDLPDVPALSEV